MNKKNILISGFDGFLGKNLTKKINLNQYNIYGIGNYKKNICLNIQNIKKKINSKNLKFFKKKKIDIIIHCAGSSGVGIEYKRDFKKNVLTAFEILEFAKEHLSKPKIIIASSLAVYGNKYIYKIKENFPLNPYSFYGLNKKISEDICLFYAKKFNMDILILRISSVFGGNQKKQFVYEATKKILNNNYNFWGSGNEVRDYIHIDDVCEIINKLLKKNLKGLNIINCGVGNVYKTAEIINKIKLILKINNNKLNFNGFRLNQDPGILIPNLNKLKSLIKFKSQRDFDNDLKQFVLQQKR